MNRADKVLGAVTVAMEMRSDFLAVFGETLIGHMTNGNGHRRLRWVTFNRTSMDFL